MSVRNGNINVKWLNELRADTTARFMHEVYMHALDNASASGGSYLVLDDSQVSTRTGAQVLSDIGALSTSGTAAASTLVTHVNQALDSTCFVSFATAATGNLAPSTNAALTFNSTNGDLGATTVTATGDITAVGTIHVDGTASASARLELSEDTDEGAHFVRIGVPALAASTNFVLPNDEGTDGYFLKTDGSGNTSWAASSGGIAFDGSTANGVLTYKDADEATVEANMTYDGADLTLTSATSGKPILTIENSNTDAVSPILKFAKTATGADADEIGRIQFEADDDANNPTVFAEIKGEIQDVTTSGTSEDGQLEFLIAQGASLVNVLKANSNVGFGTILELGDNGVLSMTQFKSTIVQFESSTSTGPIMSAVNTTADAEAPQFTFVKNRGNASGVGSTLDGDHCGLFNFRGYDAAGNITTYAWIEGTATTTSSTNEAGKIAIAVTSDGNAGASNRNVVTGTGHTTTDKVDIDLGYGTASTTTIAGNLNVNGTDHTFTSATADKPVLSLTNTNTTSTSNASLKFIKDAADVADGEFLGEILFIGDNDAGTPEQIDYAKIWSRIADMTDGSEEGSLYLGVASHDGEMNPGVSIASGNIEDEVDVTVGNGQGSLVTVPGKLSIGARIDFDSTGITGIQTAAESFSDDDVSLMTSAAIDDRINAAGGGGSSLIHVDMPKYITIYLFYVFNKDQWYTPPTYTTALTTSATIDGATLSAQMQARGANYIANSACKVKKVTLVFQMSSGTLSGDIDLEWALVKWTPQDDTANTAAMTEMTITNHDGAFTETDVHTLTFTVTDNAASTLAAKDCIAFCVRTTDQTTSSPRILFYGHGNYEIELT